MFFKDDIDTSHRHTDRCLRQTIAIDKSGQSVAIILEAAQCTSYISHLSLGSPPPSPWKHHSVVTHLPIC